MDNFDPPPTLKDGVKMVTFLGVLFAVPLLFSKWMHKREIDNMQAWNAKYDENGRER